MKEKVLGIPIDEIELTPIDNNQFVVECAHHWDIESPNGPTSRGICRHCGDEQEFSNTLPPLGWRETNTVSSKDLELLRELSFLWRRSF
ncbi:hypothetical protein HYV21_00740 [Candidatus Microgenomates bacterium]|nr:hypothetical protein [Candidatus Microgenomates bacterium]